ncbi:hypothetical protein NDQ38_13665 [Lactiplantibacillus plantarum]|uniref:hypothetical protein n=1 Tax=Lactiplantibacillus plantarum TaxID=1590 RepID=UPI00203AB888|nr:hypothetical protein [Lactiplantibacillus plantarum]MCM2635804.1 hypothetical protein [Lactiplantibacillus plantarum]
MASINKKNGKWAVRVSYYDEFGKRHFKNKSGLFISISYHLWLLKPKAPFQGNVTKTLP